jgi:3-hydroxyisobutyrate dehydrogenase
MTIEAEPAAAAGSTTPATQVGFVGLGDMGGRIARRIALAGFPLTVFDVRAAAMEELVGAGASAAEEVAGVAVASDVVCVCVVDDDQVRSVVAALSRSLRPGATLVIHSSIMPGTVRELADGLAARGIRVADAPVSGSRPAAAEGTLTVLLGGDVATANALRPLLGCYCSNIIYAGDLGAGQLLKIANNVMLHMNHLVAVEAARFARAHGISESALIEAVNVSSGRSWVTETWGLIDDMLSDHPLAGTDGIYPIMSKEMWHAVDISRAPLVPMPLTALGTQLSKSYLQEREAVAERPDSLR